MVKDVSELTEEDLSQLDWLTLQKDMNKVAQNETFKQKFLRKFAENPFVPIGALATTMALGYGIWSFRTGQRKMSQYMMRTRIVAQSFTIAALIAGVILGAKKGVSTT